MLLFSPSLQSYRLSLGLHCIVIFSTPSGGDSNCPLAPSMPENIRKYYQYSKKMRQFSALQLKTTSILAPILQINIGERSSQLFTLYNSRQRSSKGRTRVWNRFNRHFADPGCSELQCNIATRRAGARRWCQCRRGCFRPRPRTSWVLFEHLHMSWEGASGAPGRRSNPDLFRQEGSEGCGLVSESWQRERENGKSRAPGQLHKCHCSPPLCTFLYR